MDKFAVDKLEHFPPVVVEPASDDPRGAFEVHGLKVSKEGKHSGGPRTRFAKNDISAPVDPVSAAPVQSFLFHRHGGRLAG
jgi:hypothetical protein